MQLLGRYRSLVCLTQPVPPSPLPIRTSMRVTRPSLLMVSPDAVEFWEGQFEYVTGGHPSPLPPHFSSVSAANYSINGDTNAVPQLGPLPSLEVLTYHGGKDTRKVLREFELTLHPRHVDPRDYPDIEVPDRKLVRPDVVLASFEAVYQVAGATGEKQGWDTWESGV